MKATIPINRFDPRIYKPSLLIRETKKLLKKEFPELFKKKTGKRGRPPKEYPSDYLTIIVLKEANTHSLRSAQYIDSKLVVNKEVDHCVVHYWEKKLLKVIGKLLSKLASKLERKVDYSYSILDSTKLTSWLKKLIEMHALLRYIPGVTLYLAGIIFTSSQLKASQKLPKGKGPLLADRWYDDKHVLDEVVEKGYLPLIKPRGYGSMLRNKLWRDFRNKKLSKLRDVGEGFKVESF